MLHFELECFIKNNNPENRIKSIKKNFIKSSKTADTLFKNCLNGARDINYYRFTAQRELYLLDGRKQDTWLLTDDKGIHNLSQVIYFIPNPIIPTQPLACTLIDNDTPLVVKDYLEQCTKIQNRIIYDRGNARLHGTIKESSNEQLKICSTELEQYFYREENIIQISYKH